MTDLGGIVSLTKMMILFYLFENGKMIRLNCDHIELIAEK